MPVAGPFYFAWVDEGETFGLAHHRMDEYIFSARRTLAEGQKPLLEIVIENPHVGILNPNRKFWAWFAFDNGMTIVPMFYGRVVGQPSSIFEETITLQFVTWPVDYREQVQRIAETMKTGSQYDPVFIDVAQRDNPDTILEATTKMWGVDPVTGIVTADNWLEGDDGNVDFTEDDHFYDSMNMTIGQPPATAILVDANVSWVQTYTGLVDMGNRTYFSYSGDGIISEWPKPLQQLGAGWSVEQGEAVDVGGVRNMTTVSVSWSWTNPAKTHNDGDSLSLNWSATVPAGTGVGARSSMLSGILTQKSQSGVLDPYAVDSDGDPAPLNIPASAEQSTIYCPLWQVNTSLVLRYDAERPRTERIIFLVQADLQPVIVDPDVDQESETIVVSGADVGVPIINLLNWTTIAGQAVSLGQVIFPDNPQLPGGRAAQIATTAGIAGTTPPNFSDVVGVETTDGTVVWASLGTTAPTDNARNWTGVSNVPAGTVILPRRPFFTTWRTLTAPGRASFPVAGVSVQEGAVVKASNGSYHICTLGGTTNTVEPAFSGTWGSTVIDGNVEWTSLGMNLPSGNTYYIAIDTGATGPANIIPPFNETLHAQTTDGTVTWVSIGSGEIPIGGYPGHVPGRTYFMIDRGRRSLEYLALKARSKILWRSRCVGTTFQCEYERGLSLTMRKTATLHDPRIPGGLLLGKTKSVVHEANGESGEFFCSVELASTVGYGNAVTEVPGSPVYVSDGYVQDGYQQRESSVVVLDGDTDLGYTPPSGSPEDDGLIFPLDFSQILVSDEVHGDLDDQRAGIMSAFESAAKAAQLAQIATTADVNYETKKQVEIAMLNSNSVGLQLQRNPIWQDWQIKPVNIGQVNNVFNVKFTRLTVPQMIDLQTETTS